MIRVFQVKCASEKKSEIEAHLLRKLHISKKDLFAWSIHRKSVDARHQKVLFSFTLDCQVANESRCLKQKDVQKTPDESYHPVHPGTQALANRPVVVGFGPAGMFAALTLAQAGYCPIVIERGSAIKKRKAEVEKFWQTGKLNPECNVQFGQGGAGAFSDGKLTTRSKDARCRKVLEEFITFGAKEEILIDQHPHVGTDAFVKIVENCRKAIEALGGSFYFDTKLEDIQLEDGKLQKICINGKWLDCQALIVCCGHSAKDTVFMLHKRGLAMENKRFAVGVRIEHLQTSINRFMLKDAWQDPRLIPARYQLTHTASNGKGVYTFCMCPGGYVIPSSSEVGKTVINGMSYAARDGVNANSALLVQVDENDYGFQLFDGLKYQEALEEKAYHLAGGYQACVQLAKDYIEGKPSHHFEQVQPSYALGYQFIDLNTLFSPEVNQALKEALLAYEKKIPGFVSDGAVLSAVESRSSSSIRILRQQDFQSNIQGIYPSGEGSGYAGGIMTSAIDGIRAAEKLIETFSLPQYNNRLEDQGGMTYGKKL